MNVYRICLPYILATVYARPYFLEEVDCVLNNMVELAAYFDNGVYKIKYCLGLTQTLHAYASHQKIYS